MKWTRFLMVLLGIFIVDNSELLFAQEQYDLETRLVTILNDGFGQNYIIGYTQSLVNAFGTAMSGGLFHRGNIKQFPHLDLGIMVVYLKVPQKARVFRFEGGIQPAFLGTKQSSGSSGISGSGMTEIFLPQMQLNLGLTSNAELLLRGSRYQLDEIGDIRLLGAGIKFGLTDILPKYMLSLNVSVQVMYQTMKVEDWLNSATFGMNAQASSNILNSPLEIYGGIGYEITELKFDTNKLKGIGMNGLGEISLEGENDLRMNIGLSYTLLILNLHLDYNFGLNNSIAGGLMFVF